MSLINEALKQAEMDRRGVSTHPQPMTERTAEPMRSPEPALRPGSRFPIKSVSAAVIFGVIAATLIVIQTIGNAPSPAQAAAERLTSPEIKQLQADLAELKAQKTAEQSSAPIVNSTQLDPAKVAKVSTVNKVDVEEKFTFRSIADMTPKYLDPAASKKIQSQPKEVSPKTVSDNTQGDYLVTGIFHGPGGSRALINGRMLRKGQRIGNATIVRIGTDTIELDQGGQIITIGM